MTCERQSLGEKEFERLYVNEYGWEPYPLHRQLFRTLVSINALEAIRFYVSFACTFAFANGSCLRVTPKLCALLPVMKLCIMKELNA